jgi:glycosyltransferase involved in cell wall biosynthesis
MIAPLVSIGVPVLNGEKWLRRALDALLAQDYPHIEIIVSDNASTDATPTICAEYCARAGNIRVLRQTQTVGIVDNFKTVLTGAQGEYFMWAAVDDCWKPAFVSSLVRKLEADSGLAVAQSATMNLSEADLGRELGEIRFSGKRNPENCSGLGLTRRLLSLYKYNFYIYGVFRRSLLAEAFEHFPGTPSSDRLFLMQFPLAGYRFGYVDEPLYLRTIREEPVYLRYRDDPYVEGVRQTSSRWFSFDALPAINKMLNESPLTCQTGWFVRHSVLLQYVAWRIDLGVRPMVKAFLFRLLPGKTAALIINLLRKKSLRQGDAPGNERP